MTLLHSLVDGYGNGCCEKAGYHMKVFGPGVACFTVLSVNSPMPSGTLHDANLIIISCL